MSRIDLLLPMKLSRIAFLASMLAVVAASLSSCVVAVPGPPVATVGVGYFTALPPYWNQPYYYYGNRYYYGGTWQQGRYWHNGKCYEGRYSYQGRYFYSGKYCPSSGTSSAHHPGHGPPSKSSSSQGSRGGSQSHGGQGRGHH